MDLPLTAQRGAVETMPGIVDCDVHPLFAEGLPSLYPYMPAAWRERFVRKRAGLAASSLILRFAHPNGTVVRDDARTESGGPGGSDPRYLVKDLIEANDIGTVVLNSLQSGVLCAIFASVDESIVIARAANDYYFDKWLPVDPRLTYAPVVPSQDPVAAAAEIRRVAGHRQVSAIAVPPLAILMGKPHWRPILEAAAEADLPILLHVSGAEGVYAGAPMPAGGLPDTYIERYVTLSQAAEANLSSMILSGVFERYPRLKVLFVEYGFCSLGRWPACCAWTGCGAGSATRCRGSSARRSTMSPTTSGSPPSRSRSRAIRATWNG